jgi:hypothetical protein
VAAALDAIVDPEGFERNAIPAGIWFRRAMRAESNEAYDAALSGRKFPHKAKPWTVAEKVTRTVGLKKPVWSAGFDRSFLQIVQALA